MQTDIFPQQQNCKKSNTEYMGGHKPLSFLKIKMLKETQTWDKSLGEENNFFLYLAIIIFHDCEPYIATLPSTPPASSLLVRGDGEKAYLSSHPFSSHLAPPTVHPSLCPSLLFSSTPPPIQPRSHCSLFIILPHALEHFAARDSLWTYRRESSDCAINHMGLNSEAKWPGNELLAGVTMKCLGWVFGGLVCPPWLLSWSGKHCLYHHFPSVAMKIKMLATQYNLW